jgi:hypothetical protein
MRYAGAFRDYGRIRIPSLPSGIILTDRADGTLWLISHNLDAASSDGFGYISIRTPMPNVITKTYQAGEEPYFNDDPTYRLIIRNGYLGVEILPLSPHVADQDNAPIYTRKGVSSTIRKIFASQGFVVWEPDTA